MTTLTIRVYYVLWYLTYYVEVLGTRLQVDCVDSDDASIVEVCEDERDSWSGQARNLQ